MGHIATGFADQFTALNDKTAAESFIRAAGSNTPHPFAGPVHVTVVAENLDRHSQLLRKVADDTTLHGGVHAGAAGFVNLGYIASARASAAILFDINTYQKPFWDHVIDTAAQSPTAATFRARIADTGTALADATRTFPSSLREAFNRECATFDGHAFKNLPDPQFRDWVSERSQHTPDGRWMHDEAQYAHIHKLARANAIGAITLDIGSEKACGHVRSYLDERNRDVRLLYVSNILNFLQSPVRTTDFVGRPVLIDSKANAQVNLHGWLEPGAKVIECDNLVRNTPLMISGRSYAAPSPSAP